ncbi:MAG TPA: DUF6754 domain-containing protein [Candidatus Desulfaltia sp.]|nr:DUF6754 domain-containing protein [Candidatus Desulfaltia sp.]
MLFSVPGIINGRFLGFLLNIAMAALVYYYIKSKKEIHIRRVPGLDAIEEAVGRSAEMGKPVICSFGIGGFTYWTLAGLSILSHVARLSAKTGSRLIVPTGGGDQALIVRPVAEEIVKTAYTLEGVEDQYNPDDLPFLSGQQYAYVGGYVGIMQRVRPGSVIMTGSHASDAMNIAETSNAVGAITITSGSYIGNVAALACASDYILIGEEAPAAGAYLSEDPSQRASIRVQDLFKWLAIAIMILGIAARSVGNDLMLRLLST